MIANPHFTKLPKPFWACVRYISQQGGYTDRTTGGVKHFDSQTIHAVLQPFELPHQQPSGAGQRIDRLLEEYFHYRADLLNSKVRPLLMDIEEARTLYQQLYNQLQPKCPIPKNKQRGDKAGPAYLTGIVNMLIEANAGSLPVDYNPLKLATVSSGASLQHTFSRRFDGCFPNTINPIALWEIKEYYYTTTFGSRVADGIFETLLDGFELEEARSASQQHIQHLLIIDSRFTWWACGRSYLCRLIDMLHMGFVDEILFGREVVQSLPRIVLEWVASYNSR